MSNDTKGGAFYAGWALTVLPGLGLLVSASMKLSHTAQIVANFGRFGWPESLLTIIGIIEILCALTLLVPTTAVLGAVLVTGYLGGAIATHVRISDPTWPIPFAMALTAWLGVYLRDPRLRALLPLRR